MKITLMIVLLLLFVSACTAGLKGSIAPSDLIPGVQGQLRQKFYPNCTDIKPMEVVDIQPPEMKGKKVSVGDKWTEKWRISACGVAKIHPVEFEIIPPPKLTGYKVDRAVIFGVREAE
jgi:hypothetical protein